MTVLELITVLKDFPSGMEVLVQGYEGGLEPPSKISIVKIERNINDAGGFFGPHEEVRYKDSYWDAQAVVIKRS